MARKVVTATTLMWAIGMRTERGMTLLELLVVLSILGLTAGLAATAYGGRAARQQDRRISEVGLLFRAARQEAMGSGQVVRITLGDNEISAQPSRHPKILRMGDSAQLHWSPRTLGGQRSDPIFYPDGSAVPGVLELRSDAGRRRLDIDWMGGVRDVDARP